jgi:hypothetical protein
MASPEEVKSVTTTRREERIISALPVELVNIYQKMSNEATSTQNISMHGARVTTHRLWEPGSFLVIKSLRGDFSARARVVYWRSFSSSRFTIGLEFLTYQGNWQPNGQPQGRAH